MHLCFIFLSFFSYGHTTDVGMDREEEGGERCVIIPSAQPHHFKVFFSPHNALFNATIPP
jgi:hypothetical protein